jgi:hypothetical protein
MATECFDVSAWQDGLASMARQSRWQWSVNQDEMMLPGL